MDDTEWGREMLWWLQSLGNRTVDWDLAKGNAWKKNPFVVDIKDEDEGLMFVLKFGQYIIPEPPLQLPKRYWKDGIK